MSEARVVKKNQFLVVCDPNSSVEVWISPMGFLSNQTLALVDRDSETVVIVDPYNGKRWLKKLNAENLQPTHIALTHTHCDHVWGVPAILKAYPDIEIHAHKEALHPRTSLKAKMLFPSVKPTHTWSMPSQAEEEWRVGGMKWVVTHTPGHAPGHVTLQGHGFYLSGDLLFTILSGRCDIPGSDPFAQLVSLKNARDKLQELPQDQIFIPGHNYRWIDGTRQSWVTVAEVLKYNGSLQKLDQLR